MRLKPTLVVLSLIACAVVGCDITPPEQVADQCPPANYNEAVIAYIGDPSCTVEACELGDYRNNFEVRYCPKDYPACYLIEGGEDYYCGLRKDVRCASSQRLCEFDDGSFECVDPSNIKTCGAKSCDLENNYDGTDCTLYSSGTFCRADASGSYRCLCPDGALLCDNHCINPADKTMCGATSCDAENYGGDDCTSYKDGRECVHNEADDTYSCRCKAGDILCNGKCITPETNSSYCGAKGSCEGTDKAAENYAGEDCSEGSGVCVEGVCACPTGGVWCYIEGLNDNKVMCYSPLKEESCNAKLVEGTTRCEVSPCTSVQHCELQENSEYACIMFDCEDKENEHLCYATEADMFRSCVSKTDPAHCGTCAINCDNLKEKYQNVVSASCKRNDDNEPKCTYVCDEGFDNCGTEYEPVCVDLLVNKDNCGACGIACKGTESCKEGMCLVTECTPTQCSTTDAEGHDICTNLTEKCGSGCVNCKNKINEFAFCSNGTCFTNQCNDGTHPIYNDGGQIIACEKNTVTSCAPATMGFSESPVDCSALGHTANVSCSAAGACVITACEAGYHLNSSRTGCEANSTTSCAGVSSSDAQNCSSIANIASGGSSCNASGACAVSKCKAGYHLNSSKTGCEANSVTSCAGVSSSNAQNCSSIEHVASGSVSCNASGACEVTKCASGYHLNSSRTGCDANSPTSCAGVSSSDAQDCTAIAHVASGGTSCSSAGACTVSKCASGYHLNSDKTECTKNTNTSCAGVSSNSTTNCTKISNIASGGATCSSSGSCVVSKCASGYHINSGKTGCTVNSNSSCAPVNSNNAKNCTSNSVQKVCTSAGQCACSTDGSTVLNYDGNACVPKACGGIPGIKTGEQKNNNYYSGGSDYTCKAKTCNSNYSLYESGSAAVCLPKKSLGCSSLGYINSNSDGNCLACNSNWTKCGNSKCADGYKFYSAACIDLDHCCGTKNSAMSLGSDFQCTNCAAQGKTCDVSEGKCK